MTAKSLGKLGRLALWASPVVIVFAALVAAIPLLEEQDDSVALAVTAAAAIFVMGYAYFLAHKVQRGLGRPERS